MTHPKASQLTPVPAAPCPHPWEQKSAPSSTSNPPAPIPPPVPIPNPIPRMESGRRQLPQWCGTENSLLPLGAPQPPPSSTLKTNRFVTPFFFFSPERFIFLRAIYSTTGLERLGECDLEKITWRNSTLQRNKTAKPRLGTRRRNASGDRSVLVFPARDAARALLLPTVLALPFLSPGRAAASAGSLVALVLPEGSCPQPSITVQHFRGEKFGNPGDAGGRAHPIIAGVIPRAWGSGVMARDTGSFWCQCFVLQALHRSAAAAGAFSIFPACFCPGPPPSPCPFIRCQPQGTAPGRDSAPSCGAAPAKPEFQWQKGTMLQSL